MDRIVRASHHLSLMIFYSPTLDLQIISIILLGKQLLRFPYGATKLLRHSFTRVAPLSVFDLHRRLHMKMTIGQMTLGIKT